MNWRDRTAEILGNGAGAELTKPTKAHIVHQNGPGVELTKPTKALLSVLSVPPPPLSGTDTDPAAEARRQRVFELLARNSTARYALVTDMAAEDECVIVTLAIRGQATCDLHISRERYDAFLLLDLIGRYGSTSQQGAK